MADSPTFRGPTRFESPIVASYMPHSREPLTLTDESSTTKLIVRAADDSDAAAQLGVGFGSSRVAGNVHIWGQRPTEWLLVGGGEDVATFAGSLDQSGHVSLIDHTHSRALFRLQGAPSTDLLEKVCGLDWGDAMTPDGAVTSASVAKVGCDIARHDQDGVASYRIACDRSFAQYLFDALLDAGEEFGINAVV